MEIHTTTSTIQIYSMPSIEQWAYSRKKASHKTFTLYVWWYGKWYEIQCYPIEIEREIKRICWNFCSFHWNHICISNRYTSVIERNCKYRGIANSRMRWTKRRKRKTRVGQKETKHQDRPICKHTEVIICLIFNTRMQHICHGIFTIVECLPASCWKLECELRSSSFKFFSMACLFIHMPHASTYAPIDTQQNIFFYCWRSTLHCSKWSATIELNGLVLFPL